MYSFASEQRNEKWERCAWSKAEKFRKELLISGGTCWIEYEDWLCLITVVSYIVQTWRVYRILARPLGLPDPTPSLRLRSPTFLPHEVTRTVLGQGRVQPCAHLSEGGGRDARTPTQRERMWKQWLILQEEKTHTVCMGEKVIKYKVKPSCVGLKAWVSDQVQMKGVSIPL